MSYQPQNWPTPQPSRPPVLGQVPRDKSVGAALVLTFLFGPLGLFYLGAVPGIVGLFVLIPIAVVGGLVTFGAVSLFVWFITMVWAAVRAGRDHSVFQAYIARGARWP